MISEAYLRRHTAAYGGNREIALLDVVQEYVLEYLRREGVFATLLIFKGGTALRKFVFGAEGRFSVDLDFVVCQDDPTSADLILDLLESATYGGVRMHLERRKGPAAQLQLETPFGRVSVPAAISIRQRSPWLPPQERTPMPFTFLDRGVEPDFVRSALPVLDLREIAAEKIAAFWRRRKARDLYDLEHLGRVIQAHGDTKAIARLAVLKIYFDVVEEGAGRPLSSPWAIFGIPHTAVFGAEDLGYFRAANVDVKGLLAQCAQRYAALTALDDEVLHLAATCSQRDHWHALQLRDSMATALCTQA